MSVLIAQDAVATASDAQVTVVREPQRILTKQVRRTPEGTLASTGADQIVNGDFRALPASRPSSLAAIIAQLTFHEALLHGAPKSGSAGGPLVTQGAIAAGLAPSNAISRTRDAFEFVEQRAGWLMLDIDVKDAPKHLRPETLKSARAMLIAAVPTLNDAPMLALPSASANIFAAGTDTALRGLTGVRAYVLVSSAREIPEIGRRLHARLVLAGFGFAKIRASGVIAVASPLDITVWSPERLDYAAGAYCGAGLEQRRTPEMWNDAAPALTLADVPALSDAEIARCATIEAGIKAQAQAEAERKRASWFAQREQAGHKTAVTWGDSGTIDTMNAGHEIRLETGEWVDVAAILADPSAYNRRKCYDPVEPEYDGGRVVARIYSRNEDGTLRDGPIIHSKAHGGYDYVLRADAADDFAVDSVATPPTGGNGAARPPLLARYNARFAYVRALDAILYTPNANTWELLPMPAFRNYTRPDRVTVGKRRVPAADLWLESQSRRVVSRLVFEPDLPALSDVPSPNADPEPCFNTWPGLATKPSDTGSDARFIAHLRHVVAANDERAFAWVLQWLASMVQSPAQLPGTALVLRGPQGAGKDTVGEVMRALLGPSLHTTIADPEQLTGRFNAPHEGKVLLQVEEGFFAGNRGDRGKLKHLVTAPSVSIERKGVDRYEVRNCARVLITSNEEWVVPAENGERRFMVLDVSGEHANDLAYHAALRSEMFEHGGCARFLHRLLHEVVVDWSLIRRPLATTALRDQQIETLDPERRWMLDVLEDGALPGDERGDGTADKDALFHAYAAARGDRRATKTRLSRFLRSMGVTETRPHMNGRRVRVYQFPPLAECRATFGRSFAVPIEWDEQTAWGTDSLLTGDTARDVIPIVRATRQAEAS